MKKLTILTLLLALGSATFLQADIKKGQKMYLKKCKKCHGNGTKGAAMKTQDEWAEAFEDGAAGFKAWHKGTKAEKYVNGKRFGKKYIHLKDFVWEYASDSGNVPSCG